MPTRPQLVVNAGKAVGGHKDLPAATVRSTLTKKTETLKAGGRMLLGLPDTKTKVYIEALSQFSDVWVYNQSGVPLTLATKIGKDELDDVLKNNKTYKIPTGARLTVHV